MLLSISVDSLTWSAYHGDELILSNNCASMSSAIFSMRLVTVLADKGTCIIFLRAASPRSSRQMSLVEGKVNFSPMVNGYFALAIRLATKNDALNAFSFIDVVALRNFSCPSCSRFFSFKILQGLVF